MKATDFKITHGTVIKRNKDNKEFVVVYEDIVCAGNVRVIGVVKKREEYTPRILFMREICDCDFGKYSVVKY